MKSSGKMTGMVLMLLMAGTFTLSAQRGMSEMGRGFANGPMHGNIRGGMTGPGFGQGRGAGFHNGIGHAPLIPNLTEKQIADIRALGVKHQEEMTEFREAYAKKVQTMRDENHKKFLEILTDEQKKALEAAAPAKRAPVTPSAPAVKK